MDDQQADMAQAQWALSLADRLAYDPYALSGCTLAGARVTVRRPARVGAIGSVDVDSASGSVHVDFEVLR